MTPFAEKSMSASGYIADVKQQDFDSLVLQKSREVPVLVDFWAAWCGPCRMLAPILAKLADEYQGKFFLAKIDTDSEKALAAKYGIRSLPTVKLFKNHEVVNEFIGVQPEKTVRALIDRYIARESDAALYSAMLDYEAGRLEQAMQKLHEAMEADPGNDRVKLQLAKLLFEGKHFAEGETILKNVSPKGQADPDILALFARLEFIRVAAEAKPAAELEKLVAADPGNSQARYQLSALKILNNEFEAACRHLLEIVKRDRKFRDDGGRKALLTLFNLLGGKDELVKKYRHLLSIILN